MMLFRLFYLFNPALSSQPVTGLSSNSIWVLGGQLLSQFIASDRAIRAQNIAFRLMLLVVAVWLIL